VVGKPHLEWQNNKINGSIQVQMDIVRSTVATTVIEVVAMEAGAEEAIEGEDIMIIVIKEEA